MKLYQQWRVALVIGLLLLASLACSFSFNTANVGEAYMAKDQDGKQKSSEFVPSDTFYAIVKINNAADDTKVKSVWTAVEVEGEEPNTEIQQTEVEAGSGTAWFSLENNNGMWPVGKYKVDIFMNDKKEKTLEFTVVSE